MSNIKTILEIADKMTAPIMAIRHAVSGLEDRFDSLGNAAEVDSSSLLAMKNHLALNSAAARVLNDNMQLVVDVIRETENPIRANTAAQQAFNDELANGVGGANLLKKSLFGIAGFLGLRQAGTFAGMAFDRIDTMNQFERTVGILTGDANRAAAAIEVLRDNVTGTAFALDTAADATRGFMTRGIELEAAADKVRVWADAVSFYGRGTNAELETVVDTLGNMYTKGTVEMQQLRRLFMVGINAPQIYADAVGQSVSRVQADLSAGAISAVDFINTVTAAMDAGVSANAAHSVGETWAGVFSNLRIRVARGFQELIESVDASLAASNLPSLGQTVQNVGKSVENVMKIMAAATRIAIQYRVPIIFLTGAYAAYIAAKKLDVAVSKAKAYIDMKAIALQKAKTVSLVGLSTAQVVAAKAQIALNVAVWAFPFAAIIGAVGLVVGALVGFGKAAAGAAEETRELASAGRDLRESLETSVRGIEGTAYRNIAAAEASLALANRFYELAHSAERTGDDINRMKGIVTQLSDVMPDLFISDDIYRNADALRDMAGAMQNVGEAYSSYINAKSWADAYSEMITEALKAQIKAEQLMQSIPRDIEIEIRSMRFRAINPEYLAAAEAYREAGKIAEDAISSQMEWLSELINSTSAYTLAQENLNRVQAESNMGVIANEIKNTVAKQTAAAYTARLFAEEYEKLYASGNRSAEAMAKMNTAVDYVNSAIPNLNAQFDAATGAIDGITGSLYAAANAFYDYAAAKAYASAYEEKIKDNVSRIIDNDLAIRALDIGSHVSYLNNMDEYWRLRDDSAALQNQNQYFMDEMMKRLPDVFTGDTVYGNQTAANTARTAANTARTAELGEENVKYLRDIAEREAVNEFTVAEVFIDFGGIQNHINSEMDLDGVINYIAEGTREAVEFIAEGVHA
jgi:tape measure domain-containing protein